MVRISRLPVVVVFSLCMACAEPFEPVESKKFETEMVLSVKASDFCGEWTAGDTISIVDNTGAHHFTTESSGSVVPFSGEAYKMALSHLAVSPASGWISMEDETLSLNLPVFQNSFSPISVSKSSGSEFEMEPVTAGVSFKVVSSYVCEALLRGNDGEKIAGNFALSFSDRNNSFKTGEGSEREITFALQEGRGATDTVECVISCLPVKFTSGFKLFLFHESGLVDTCRVDSLVDLSAGKLYEMGPSGRATGDEPKPKLEEDIDITFHNASGTVWPFRKPAMSDISQSYYSKASFPNSTVDFILPEDSGGYIVTIHSTTGFARNSSVGLKMGGGIGDYIQAPALFGLYLTSISYTTGNENSACGSPVVKGPDGEIVAGGDTNPQFKTEGSTYVWKLYDTKKCTPYKLELTEAFDIFVERICFHYDCEPLSNPAVEYGKDVEASIPDYSRVGYHHGEKAIPDIPVKMTLTAPADGSDASEMIQNSLNTVSSPGAVLLKAGKYNVSDTLVIRRSGVVLRGEGEGTVIYCTSEKQLETVIEIGGSTSKALTDFSDITAGYVPEGQMWVPVGAPELFSVGDMVYIYRPATMDWLNAIHMREIPQNSENSVEQWNMGEFALSWQRTVVAKEEDRIYLDNPVVMGLGSPGNENWGRGFLYKARWDRISECGVENLTIDCRYDATKMNGDDYVDEDHAWSGVTVRCAENCWVRNIVSHHLGYSCVRVSGGSHLVTVSECQCLDPVSKVEGSRRYAFNLSGGAECCLFTRCHCDNDRHQYICGQRVSGPSVFHRCTSTQARSEAGPHQKWATGILYDNLKTDGALNLHDRNNYGSGHGWTCANTIIYNCEAASIVCQSPWASAVNRSIGCIGTHKAAARSYPDGLGPRPEGIWISEGVHVSPESLYETQLADRLAAGVLVEK